jgi:hypothetical protein
VISPKHIDRISYEKSKVFVNVTKRAILEARGYHVPPSVISTIEIIRDRRCS